MRLEVSFYSIANLQCYIFAMAKRELCDSFLLAFETRSRPSMFIENQWLHLSSVTQVAFQSICNRFLAFIILYYAIYRLGVHDINGVSYKFRQTFLMIIRFVLLQPACAVS